MPLRIGADMPSFDGATHWFNGTADNNSLKGKPSIVYFWANSCHICKDNMPALKELKSLRAGQINVVAVHRPRQESDMDVAEIEKALRVYEID